MFEKLEIFSMAQALARHGAARQAAIARNIANADTPGYRARDLPSFADAYRTDAAGGLRATRASHHMQPGSEVQTARASEALRPDAAGPNGNNVSIEQEMFASAVAKREHDRALAIYRSALSVLRTSVTGQR